MEGIVLMHAFEIICRLSLNSFCMKSFRFFSWIIFIISQTNMAEVTNKTSAGLLYRVALTLMNMNQRMILIDVIIWITFKVKHS